MYKTNAKVLHFPSSHFQVKALPPKDKEIILIMISIIPKYSEDEEKWKTFFQDPWKQIYQK